jgi:hypothetical protein
MMNGEDDRAVSALLDGSAWSTFCRQLEAAGHVVLRDGSPEAPFDRAEGYRYLTRILRAALETFVEHHDPRAPVLHRVVHETVKMGADNPDNHYLTASISGAHTYRLYGRRGTSHWLEFATQKGHYGQGRGMPPTGHLDARDMAVAADGAFEIALSCETQPGNWLPMEPETGTLIVRQSRMDTETEVLADLHIARTDGAGGPSPVDPATLAWGLSQAGLLVGGAAAIFATWAEGFIKHTNQLPRFDPRISNAFGGVPTIAYYHSYWRLEPDEVLVVEATPPPCDHWNFQLNNHWMESLDYRYHRIHVNSHTAAVEDDGSIRIIVAHEDPGHPNWIETVGHDRGTMCFRWVRPEVDDPPEPRCEVMTLEEVRDRCRG